MSDNKRVIGIFTTKGGTGKTTLALNLAVLLGEKNPTLFVDMDTNYTVTSLLKISITDFEEIMSGKEAKSHIGKATLIHAGKMRQVNQQLLKMFWNYAKRFERVVLDFHNSATPIVVSFLGKADITLVPVSPTMAGMGAYIHTQKILEKFGVNHLGVVNGVHHSLFGIRKDEREIIARLREKGQFWDGYIPYDKAVALAELNHKPVVMNNAPFTKSLRRLCQEVILCQQ